VCGKFEVYQNTFLASSRRGRLAGGIRVKWVARLLCNVAAGGGITVQPGGVNAHHDKNRYRISQEIGTLAKPNYNPKSGVSLFCHVCLPIMLGAGIYSLWRSKRLLVFTWYGWLGLQAPLLALRANLAGVRHFLPDFVLYSLPDALWVYSFTFLMQSVWFRHSRSYGRTFWILLPVSLAVGAEIGQYLKVVPGTFDLMDIAGYVAAWAAASMFIRTCCRRDNLEIRA
jgi:hypothetical protein